MRVALGLDIGTTSLCCIAVDIENGEILKSDTVPNDSFIKSEKSFEKIQNPEIIIEKILGLLEKYTFDFDDIASIGITGQMHGILYLDSNGKSVSPLYTWQDGRGDLVADNSTYAELFSKITESNSATGYGLVTHFYNLKNSLVPKNAVKLSTIHDYVAMRLCSLKKPITHISDAASLGAFDINENKFKTDMLKNAGIDEAFLPDVTADMVIVGDFQGIPVSVAIGDNQASFLGSVSSDDMLLINVGTGSQVSVITDTDNIDGDCEIRPLYSKKRISVGACLCGGRAYNILHSFFEMVGKQLFNAENNSLYDAMDTLVSEENFITVDTRFSGTRKNPEIRGSINNIGVDNFTPSAIITGVLSGMVNELENLYNQMESKAVKPCVKIVGSGNGIRLNRPLCRMIEKSFGMKIMIPKHKEEAAFGAVIFSLVASGEYENILAAQNKLVKYEVNTDEDI